MKKYFKLIAFAMALFITTAFVVSCGGKKDETVTPYSITVKALSGKPVKDCDISVTLDGTNVARGLTDSKGTYTFVADPAEYTVRIGTPEGYVLSQSSYKTDVSKTPIEVTANTQLITSTPDSNFVYSLGDPMYDFYMATSDGDTISLAEELDAHDLVVLNFWYTTCSACISEMAAIETSYTQYKENISLIGINPGSSDTLEAVQSFVLSYGVTYPMGIEASVDRMFNVTGYPTTVFIDRYATVAEVVVGSMPTAEEWKSKYDTYLSEDYVPTYKDTSSGEEEERVIPNVSQAESSVLEIAANGEGFTGSYTPETNSADALYSWPWEAAVKNGAACIKPTNSGTNNSFAIVYTSVYLEEGQTLTFDYFASSESQADICYVTIDGNVMYNISGVASSWQTCYAYAATYTGEHSVGFVYLKDTSAYSGDDSVYIKNIHVISSSEIDQDIVFLKNCAEDLDGFTEIYNHYITPVYNEVDGLYHVGSANGPLVLANLNNPSAFSNDTLYSYAEAGELVINGVDYNKIIADFASYASNSKVFGYVSVNRELYEALNAIVTFLSVNGYYENQWLELCVYQDCYGPTPVEFTDPIKGLAPFNAYVMEETPADALAADTVWNTVTYTQLIMPRGYLYKFVPSKSGVYRVWSNATQSVESWVNDENDDLLYSFGFDTIGYVNGSINGNNFDYNYYFEAGKTYFIRAGFFDFYTFESIDFAIKYVATTVEELTLCSPSYYIGDVDNMQDESALISGGITVRVDDQGYYREVLEDNTLGSYVYLNMSFGTMLFTSGENILDMLATDNMFNFDVDDQGNPLTTNYGDKKERMLELYNTYKETLAEGGEFIKVNEEIAEILELLMNKYSFRDIDYSWLKLCYYYKTIGA